MTSCSGLWLSTRSSKAEPTAQGTTTTFVGSAPAIDVCSQALVVAPHAVHHQTQVISNLGINRSRTVGLGAK